MLPTVSEGRSPFQSPRAPRRRYARGRVGVSDGDGAENEASALWNGYFPTPRVLIGWVLFVWIVDIVLMLLVDNFVVCGERKDTDRRSCTTAHAFFIAAMVLTLVAAVLCGFTSAVPVAPWKRRGLPEPVYTRTNGEVRPSLLRSAERDEQDGRTLTAAGRTEEAGRAFASAKETRGRAAFPAFNNGAHAAASLMLPFYVSWAILLGILVLGVWATIDAIITAAGADTETGATANEKASDTALFLFGLWQLILACIATGHYVAANDIDMLTKGYFVQSAYLVLASKERAAFWDPTPVLSGGEPARVPWARLLWVMRERSDAVR